MQLLIRFMNRFFKYSFIIGCSILMTACNTSQEKQKAPLSFTEKYAEALQQQINLDSLEKVNLLPEAQKNLANWPAFLTLQNEVKRLDEAKLQEVANNCNNLLNSIQEVEKTLPEVFQEKAIQARIRVLKTKTAMLRQNLSTPSTKPQTIESLAKEIYAAFQNLKIQLNEVFLKNLEDIEKELERAIQPDSLPAKDSLRSTTEPLKPTS